MSSSTRRHHRMFLIFCIYIDFGIYDFFWKKLFLEIISKQKNNLVSTVMSQPVSCSLDISWGKNVVALFKVITRIIYIQKIWKARLYLLVLALVYCLNVNTNEMYGIIMWPINSSKRKQNKSKTYTVSLSSSDEDAKVQSTAKKCSWKKRTQ